MNAPKIPSLDHLGNDKNKNSNHSAQKRKFSAYLFRHTATCSMVSKAIEVPQKCLTRYKRELEKRGQLVELYKDNCKQTGFTAAYLTCKPELIKKGGRNAN